MTAWSDEKFVAFDFETSGTSPAYALQPWRVETGEAWVTSLVWCERVRGRIVPHGGLNPSRDMMRDMLERAIARDQYLVGWNTAFDISWLLAYGLEDLVFKARWLDGMLLWRHWFIEPEYDTDRPNKRSYGLKACVAEVLPEHAGYEEDIDFHSTAPEDLARLHAYNTRDTIFTLRLTRHWWQKLAAEPQRLKAALIEARMLPHVALANLRGVPVDTVAARHLSAKLANDAAALLEELAPHGVTEQIIRSPTQLARLLFDDWRLPVLKENTGRKTGKVSRATDKETLHELAFVDPRARKLREYREALNNRTKFTEALLASAEYNGDGRTRPMAHIFGTYCVPGNVEVLTREGWCRLDEWTGGEIMQARPDLSLEFLPAERHVGDLTAGWVHVQQKSFNCLFTPEHTVPYLAQKTWRWRTVPAARLLQGEVKNIPVAGYAQITGSITPEQMRVLVAIQADGYVTDRYTKFTLVKPRKVARLKSLLDAVGVRYRVSTYSSYPDRTEIVIAKSFRPGWMSAERKVFGPWVLDTSLAGLQAFIDEVRRWDGSERADGGFKYVSSIEQNVDWVLTVAALTGRKASRRAPQAQGRYRPLYCCHISDARPIRAISPRYARWVEAPQQAFCAVTQTGFWLARSHGQIFITGNSGRLTYSSRQGSGASAVQTGFALHQMKRDKLFRATLQAPPGYTIVEVDAAGQEFRWMAIASGDETMLQLCLPGEDAHTFMGAQIKGMDYRTLMALVEADDPDARNARQLGKVANLSLQYRTSAAKLCTVARVQYNLPMELPEAMWIHKTYQASYKQVPIYWQKQISMTKRLGYVETFAGRRVQVTGDWEGRQGWAMGSTAINYRIQGTGADQKYLAIAVLSSYLREVGAYFAWDLHDGIYMFVPTPAVSRFVAEVPKLLAGLPYRQAWGFSPPIPLPWDIKVGPTWGALKEVKQE
jgi:DNA polymerase I-like protein with 3'-5' exonuclease and polymerase domains